MSTVLGIDTGSRGAIVEGRLIDALDMPCLNDGPRWAPRRQWPFARGARHAICPD
jgi:hypothetical protein